MVVETEGLEGRDLDMDKRVDKEDATVMAMVRGEMVV